MIILMPSLINASYKGDLCNYLINKDIEHIYIINYLERNLILEWKFLHNLQIDLFISLSIIDKYWGSDP